MVNILSCFGFCTLSSHLHLEPLFLSSFFRFLYTLEETSTNFRRKTRGPGMNSTGREQRNESRVGARRVRKVDKPQGYIIRVVRINKTW